MKLIWWKKHGEHRYEIAVETGWWRKKVVSYRQTRMWSWCDTYYGKQQSSSTQLTLTGYEHAIEWGTHDDKERKDTQEPSEVEQLKNQIRVLEARAND